MKPFKYERPTDVSEAIKTVAGNPKAKFLAGGSNLVDLMRSNVAQPEQLVDINRLEYSKIESKGESILIGALAKNKDTANHPIVKQNVPLLSQAILAGASAQIRNMATNGGNINQRTRCAYFYDTATDCNKREPGTGCSARKGLNRMSAILGWSESCVATNPSDMCVALYALKAVVNTLDVDGNSRQIPIVDFHLLPGESPEIDNVLAQGELVTSIEIPKNGFANHSYYLKIRDRASYAFALVSVAAALELQDGLIQDAQIVLGGVAAKPWVCKKTNSALKGKAPSKELFESVAKLDLEDAKPLGENGYKVELAKRAIIRALSRASA